MERLQDMLIRYNMTIPEEKRHSWSKQYLSPTYPLYWQVVYSQLAKLDRSLRVLEIGAGQGDVTAISCYLGFKDIKSYERTVEDYAIAQKKIASLFGRSDILINDTFNSAPSSCDILILVNCAYADDCRDKDEYMTILKEYYNSASCPQLYIMEVIDSSYDKPDDNFPLWIRLSEQEIREMFPESRVTAIETYKYPVNKRSKKLYIINRTS